VSTNPTGVTGGLPASDKPPLKPVYLILGDDTPKVEAALRRLRRRITDESGTELNIDEFRAGQHSAGQVIAAANTLAFLGGVRLVLVHDVEGWRKPDKEAIAAYVRSPAPDACLALVGQKLPAGDLVRRAVEEAGEVLEYVAPKPWQLPEWASRQAAKVGLQLGTAEARLLVDRVGDHQQVILREIEKLSVYKGRARVSGEDVELLAARSMEARVFDLVDAVATRHAGAAFSVLEDLYVTGERPGGLFFRLARHFDQLFQAVVLREAGWGPEQIRGELGMKPFPAKKLVQQAGSFDRVAAQRALGILAAADARMKGMGDLPAELELELCIGRLLALDR
jgi:DNA polymerase-3 subunit delta